MPSQAWASGDGRRWEPLGVLGKAVPRAALARDGVRMLILDPGDWSPFSETALAWESQRLALPQRPDLQRPAHGAGVLARLVAHRPGLAFSGSDQVWLAVAS